MPGKNTATGRRADRGLIEKITRFSDLLRDKGVAVSLPTVLDTLRGLTLIDIGNLAEFKCLLRVNLICRKEDLATFNRLFNAFWLAENQTLRTAAAEKVPKPGMDDDPPSQGAVSRKQPGLPGEKEPAASQQRRIRYSPAALAKTAATADIRFEQCGTLYETVAKLLQPLNNRLSRRFQYTIRGKQISLRRVLRKNMQFGGELIFLDFQKKKVKKRRVVFLCDVSGSMDVHTLLILQFIHALKRLDNRTEIFFFTTDLSRGTSQFELRDFTAAISRIPDLVADWGGGTRIGHCLRIFNQGGAQCMLSGKDIVIIFSDGWDRGEIDELDTQMAALKRKTHKIIWLNPLLSTRDYQPICQGMRTALPYVDYFLPIGTLQDLVHLNRTLLRVMI